MLALTAGNQVLDLAMKLEEVARDFYYSLALCSDNPAIRDFCGTTSREEMRHYTLFKGMLKDWVASTEPYLTAPDAVEEMVSLAMGTTQPDPTVVHRVAVGGNLADAVAMAVDMEKAAIVFYERLTGALPNMAGPLSGVLAEERKHLSWLSAMAGSLRAAG